MCPKLTGYILQHYHPQRWRTMCQKLSIIYSVSYLVVVCSIHLVYRELLFCHHVNRAMLGFGNVIKCTYLIEQSNFYLFYDGESES